MEVDILQVGENNSVTNIVQGKDKKSVVIVNGKVYKKSGETENIIKTIKKKVKILLLRLLVKLTK